FVHIDGSHAYECVTVDIRTAVDHMIEGTVIVVDDYRSAHTPGVAAAVWEAAAAGLIYPFCISRTKIYAAASRDDQERWLKVTRQLSETGDGSWRSDAHFVLGMELIRLAYLRQAVFGV